MRSGMVYLRAGRHDGMTTQALSHRGPERPHRSIALVSSLRCRPSHNARAAIPRMIHLLDWALPRAYHFAAKVQIMLPDASPGCRRAIKCCAAASTPSLSHRRQSRCEGNQRILRDATAFVMANHARRIEPSSCTGMRLAEEEPPASASRILELYGERRHLGRFASGLNCAAPRGCSRDGG